MKSARAAAPASSSGTDRDQRFVDCKASVTPLPSLSWIGAIAARRSPLAAWPSTPLWPSASASISPGNWSKSAGTFAICCRQHDSDGQETSTRPGLRCSAPAARISIDESIRGDHLRLFLFVALPLARPAIAALSIILFLASWNNYLWPLLIASDRAMFPAPVALGCPDRTDEGILGRHHGWRRPADGPDAGRVHRAATPLHCRHCRRSDQIGRPQWPVCF
ncbi:hypothetical protein EV665_1633 [Shinella granuli]|uniref:sn-glycerol-3-phosphate transport system permease protein UgpE n=1 Tax=Shinella granuli TaxID=323621 RepID=A0A4R2BSA4_SHIGR|nr:hypothetical protein EV665_1633 [Shinella granuli]